MTGGLVIKLNHFASARRRISFDCRAFCRLFVAQMSSFWPGEWLAVSCWPSLILNPRLVAARLRVFRLRLESCPFGCANHALRGGRGRGLVQMIATGEQYPASCFIA